MKTTGNTIFISGGSAGIGLEIAKQFSEMGNKVIINGRNPERLKNALGQLKNAAAIQGDLSLESERIRISSELKKNYPDLNIIVNNAGEASAYSLGVNANAYEKAKTEIEVNYLGIMQFTELLLTVLLEKDSAAIVNVTSITAFKHSKALPTYAASKSALHSYTQSLRETLIEKKQLQVFEVLPPLVNTEFSSGIGGSQGIPPKEVADELMKAFENNQLDVPVGMTKELFKKLAQLK